MLIGVLSISYYASAMVSKSVVGMMKNALLQKSVYNHNLGNSSVLSIYNQSRLQQTVLQKSVAPRNEKNLDQFPVFTLNTKQLIYDKYRKDIQEKRKYLYKELVSCAGIQAVSLSYVAFFVLGIYGCIDMMPLDHFTLSHIGYGSLTGVFSFGVGASLYATSLSARSMNTVLRSLYKLRN